MQQRSNPFTWIEIEYGQVALEVDQFPDGSFRFTVDCSELDIAYEIKVVLKSTLPEAIIALYQVVDGIQRYFSGSAKIELHVQTMPDQRADRVERPGQSVPAGITADLLSTLAVDEINIYDPHSDMCIPTLHRNVVVHTAAECFEWTLWESHLENCKINAVVAVDKGARKRAEEVAYPIAAQVIYADKKRVDGKVVGHVLDGTTNSPVFAGSHIWVVDDLCDGGATFISIAKLLQEEYPDCHLHLYVTHGLFSKGKEELLKYYDNVIARFDYSN